MLKLPKNDTVHALPHAHCTYMLFERIEARRERKGNGKGNGEGGGRSALDWLAEQDEATRSLLFVYSVTARDYGSPTTRERCVVTSFALEGEEDVNPAHV